MTQEEKELLLKDLSGRLPYGVKICYIFNGEECVSTIEKIDAFGYIWDNYEGCYHVKEIKPYLFPLSSMTEEQKREYNSWKHYVPTYHYEYGDIIEEIELFDSPESFEYLIENNFDYRGLIPMGLAIDATDKNVY